jgi:acetylornithine deacetylase/succinyl-diaminopimelate desuccinylase-like protein
VDFNFRFSTESTPESLKARVDAILERHGLEYSIDWTLGRQALPHAARRLVETLTGRARGVRRRARDQLHRRHLRRPLHHRHLPEWRSSAR